MCKPDLSFVTFSWINETAQHEDQSSRYPTQKDNSQHECVNWQRLKDWAGARTIDLYQTELLRKPTHGLQYDETAY